MTPATGLTAALSPGKTATKLDKTWTAWSIDMGMITAGLVSQTVAVTGVAASLATDRAINALGVKSPEKKLLLKTVTDAAVASIVPGLGLPYLLTRTASGPIKQLSAALATKLPTDNKELKALVYKATEILTLSASQSLLSASLEESPQPVERTGEQQARGCEDFHESQGIEGRRWFSERCSKEVRSNYQDGDCVIVEGCTPEQAIKGIPSQYMECDSKDYEALGPISSSLESLSKKITATQKSGNTPELIEQCTTFLSLMGQAKKHTEARNKQLLAGIQDAKSSCQGDVHFVAGVDHFTPAIKAELTVIKELTESARHIGQLATRSEKTLIANCEAMVQYGKELARYNQRMGL